MTRLLLKYIIMGLCCMFVLTACQDSPFFFRYTNVDYNGWHLGDTAVFELPVADEGVEHDVFVSARIANGYKYRDLHLLVAVECEGLTVWCDTVDMEVFDDKGHLTGSGFPFIENKRFAGKMRFAKDKQYKLKVTHVMRANPLKGVTDVGVKVN